MSTNKTLMNGTGKAKTIIFDQIKNSCPLVWTKSFWPIKSNSQTSFKQTITNHFHCLYLFKQHCNRMMYHLWLTMYFKLHSKPERGFIPFRWLPPPLFFGKNTQGWHIGRLGGAEGAKAPLKVSKKKEKIEKVQYFHASNFVKIIAFLPSLRRKCYMLWKDFYHNFST